MKKHFFQQIFGKKKQLDVCKNDFITSFYPRLYNKDGKRMKVWFLTGTHYSESPYGYESKYFLWDKHNVNLKTHFYIDDAIDNTLGTPSWKYGLICSTNLSLKKGFEKDLDFVFTYDEKLLNTINNAKFYPSCAHITYGIDLGGVGQLDKFAYLSKINNISVKTSNLKCFPDINKYVNVIQNIAPVDSVLTNYRYSIALEDETLPYYFTEKLLNCFVSMTIPIYYGATKISDFFNPNGVIQISKNDFDNIDTILDKCTDSTYNERLPAILDNFERVQKYLNMDDYLFEKYFTE